MYDFVENKVGEKKNRLFQLNFFSLLACTWRHEILKSKIKELPKFLSLSGRRGANFISVYNFSAQPHTLFGNQRILNFRVMAVRDI